MSELHETIMGRKFFMSDFPSLTSCGRAVIVP